MKGSLVRSWAVRAEFSRTRSRRDSCETRQSIDLDIQRLTQTHVNDLYEEESNLMLSFKIIKCQNLHILNHFKFIYSEYTITSKFAKETTPLLVPKHGGEADRIFWD